MRWKIVLIIIVGLVISFQTGILHAKFVLAQQKLIKYKNFNLVNYIEEHAFPNINFNDKSILELKSSTNAVNHFVLTPELTGKYDKHVLSIPAKDDHLLKNLVPFCDDVLKSIVPLIRLNGNPIAHKDCRVVDILNYSGAYFPKLHNDLEWTYFSEDTPGFQVWYLLHTEDTKRGNMFLSIMQEQCGIQQVEMKNDEELVFINNGSTLKDNTPSNESFSIPLSEINLEYVDISPGQCLVFHKNLLHMSDPRINHSNRVAINFRVAICDSSGKLALKNVKNDLYLRFKNPKIGRYIKSIPDNVHQMKFRIGRFELA